MSMRVRFFAVFLLSLLPFLMSFFCYHKHYSSSDISRNLVVKRNGIIVGYIKGSAHFSLTEDELKKDKKSLDSILKEVSTVFFEAPTGHWSLMPIGLERIAHEVIEKSDHSVKTDYVESLDAQYALLGSLYHLGPDIYYIPYGTLYMDNLFAARFLNQVNHILCFPPNFVYQNFIHGDFAHMTHQAQSLTLKNVRDNFLRDRTGVFDSKEIEKFRIIERDQRIYLRLHQSLGGFSEKNKFLLVLGMMHLSTDDGILSHFRADGYTIEPMR